jgi:S1-C subfamily serine protease
MDVITHINERPIRDADQLILEINELLAGTPVRLAVQRGGRNVTFSVALAKYPVSGRKIVTRREPSWRGIRTDYATAVDYQEQLRLGNIDLDGCVRISDVEKESPAWRQGLRAGMYVSHVENRRVCRPQDFRTAVAGRDGPVRLRLTLPSDQRPVRSVPPEA